MALSYLSVLMGLYMFIFALLGQQLFSHELLFCDLSGVPSAAPMCPPGEDVMACPDVQHCYAPCDQAQADTWITYSNNVWGGPPDAAARALTALQRSTLYPHGCDAHACSNFARTPQEAVPPRVLSTCPAPRRCAATASAAPANAGSWAQRWSLQ